MKMARHQNEDVLGLFEGLDVIKMKTSLLTIGRASKLRPFALVLLPEYFWPKGKDNRSEPRSMVTKSPMRMIGRNLWPLYPDGNNGYFQHIPFGSVIMAVIISALCNCFNRMIRVDTILPAYTPAINCATMGHGGCMYRRVEARVQG